ncbi:peptidase inhibitor family I36 protein [Kitasatospora sp. NPDC001261]|uniref:peptidase inhibitor family I36 protein n=1 Tax=Kitasatospora sp. NPDC001261 TaxID=3364012 RepID=UPI0036BC6AFC
MRFVHKAGIVLAAGFAAATTLLAPVANAQPAVSAAPSDCYKGYICGYKYSNYQGLAFRFSDCGVLQEIPNGLNSGGSWYNNQSTGTKAKMYDKYKNLIYTTPGAPYGDPNANWAPVWYVKAC